MDVTFGVVVSSQALRGAKYAVGSRHQYIQQPRSFVPVRDPYLGTGTGSSIDRFRYTAAADSWVGASAVSTLESLHQPRQLSLVRMDR
jgi:hypothetical protein